MAILGKVAATIIGGFFTLLMGYAGVATVVYFGGGAGAVATLNAQVVGWAGSVVPGVINLGQEIFNAAMGAI